jgi:anti-sigma factor RsiW
VVKAVPPDLDDAALRRYLLGLLPEAEAEPLEEAYFARPEVLERVRGVEDDLLDDYASGRLAPGERGAFEGRYLASPPLRERVVAARALRLASADRLHPSETVGGSPGPRRRRAPRGGGSVEVAAPTARSDLRLSSDDVSPSTANRTGLAAGA